MTWWRKDLPLGLLLTLPRICPIVEGIMHYLSGSSGRFLPCKNLKDPCTMENLYAANDSTVQMADFWDAPECQRGVPGESFADRGAARGMLRYADVTVASPLVGERTNGTCVAGWSSQQRPRQSAQHLRTCAAPLASLVATLTWPRITLLAAGSLAVTLNFKTSRATLLHGRVRAGDTFRARRNVRQDLEVNFCHSMLTTIRRSGSKFIFIMAGLISARALASTKEKQVLFPAESLSDFRMWKLCLTMPLASGFSQGSLVPSAFAFRRCSIAISFHTHRLSKTSLLTATQTSAIHSTEPIRMATSSPKKAEVGADNETPTVEDVLGCDAAGVEPPSANFLTAEVHHSSTVSLLILQGTTVSKRIAYSPPTKAIRVQSPAEQLRVFARGNRAGRYRWSASFLGDLPFPPPFHSGDAPYSSQAPSSALKTLMLGDVQISSLSLLLLLEAGKINAKCLAKRTFSPLAMCCTTVRQSAVVTYSSGGNSANREPLTACSSHSGALEVHEAETPPAGQYTRLKYEPGATVAERLACSHPTPDFRMWESCTLRNYSGNLPVYTLSEKAGICAGQCRWSADFLGDLPFPLDSGAAPYSPHFTLIGSQDVNVKSPQPQISSLTSQSISSWTDRCPECLQPRATTTFSKFVDWRLDCRNLRTY
ncbi:hypothetical protein PR048_008799 [Dryococelus australis]|uniref:Uncharacterized protein n=1 Tax=Dryococelus australis TaxID=614101 RepID=A0ABQ9HY48_9NEOP|nr:hypothetical protein PR048_008799 [Dryococelus australis]